MILQKTLPRCSPEQAGVDTNAVDSWLAAIRDRGIEMNSFQLLRGGRVFAEGWWSPYAPEEPHVVHSFTKSVCSTAIGMLCDEGRISVQDKVLEFFPDYEIEPPCENLSLMRVEHLLTMTCGHAMEPRRDTLDWVGEFLRHPVPYLPGTQYLYNSMSSYMLAAIIKRVSGQNMTDYLRFRLFEPLGISDIQCERCPLGIDIGGGGLLLRTEDMAKLGQFYLQQGIWDGKQLLSKAWMDTATAVHSQYETADHRVSKNQDSAAGYGYQIWRCRHPGAFRFDGAYGQYTVVIPSHDAVVVTTASTPKPDGIVELIWSHLLPGFSPDNRTSSGGEPLRPGNLRLDWFACLPAAPLQAEISGRKLILQEDAPDLVPTAEMESRPPDPRIIPKHTGLKSLSLRFEKDTCRLTVDENGKEVILVLGTQGNPYIGWLPAYANTYKTASTATWLDAHTLQLNIRLLYKAYHRRITLCFTQTGATLTFAETPAPTPPQTVTANWEKTAY